MCVCVREGKIKVFFFLITFFWCPILTQRRSKQDFGLPPGTHTLHYKYQMLLLGALSVGQRGVHLLQHEVAPSNRLTDLP